jgi:hypothetical protein
MTPLIPRSARALLAGVAAVAAIAGSASASAFTVNDPALDVPAGKIEHVVTEFRTTGTPEARHTLDELYLGSDKAHWISRDAATGAVVRETTWNAGTATTYDAKANAIDRFTDGATTPPWQTLAQEAAIWKDAYETGKTTKTGDATALGRPGLVLQSVPGKWTTDEPTSTTTMVVDAETFIPYEINTVLPRQGFTQDVTIKSYETLDRTAQNEGVFAMAAHPGAKGARSARKKKATKNHGKKHPRKAVRHRRHHR